MKKHLPYILLFILNISIFAFFLVQYMSAAYPNVGHDFRLFIPRLVDTHLYYKVSGFSIQWYTPSFGGGLPAYPNPNQMQFSLPQLFTWFFNPWLAVLISISLFALIGFTVMFFLLKDCLEYQPLPALLGAFFFVGNGFFIERAVVGHLNFITFPLIVVPLYALLSPKLPNWLAGTLIAITAAILVNSGGVYIGIICVFMLLLSLPIIYLLKPALLNWRKIFPTFLWAGALALLLCGSKVYAISSMMQFFTRVKQDHYPVDWATSVGGLIAQLVGVMTALPFLNLVGKSSLNFVVRLMNWTGSPYGFWELDASISPVLTFLLILGAGKIIFHKPKIEKTGLLKKLTAAGWLVFFIILVVQFSTARGFLFEHLRQLPLLRSTWVNTRFTASFILPLALLGTGIFDNLAKQWSAQKKYIVFAILNITSIASLGAYYLLPFSVQERYFNLGAILPTYNKIQAGAVFPVKQIIPDMNDYEVFKAQASNTAHHYDPMFGENTLLPQVREGSVFDIQNGYYNMTDPSGYVFPAENSSDLFSRIPVSDYQKLVDFINRRPSDWKLPLVQIIFDWAAGITFVLEMLAILVFLISRGIGFQKRKN